MLIGASGSGKTAVAELLDHRAPWAGHTHYFDSIGIPSREEMESFGGGEGWQEWATAKWINQLAQNDSPVQLLEGQTRPSYILPVLADLPRIQPTIILLECRPDVRRQRLTELRTQPELANTTTDSWAVYLRGQVDALQFPVIDTSDLTLEEVASDVESVAGLGDARGDGRNWLGRAKSGSA